MPKIAIIGGGISGLSCAYRLLELAKEFGKELEVRIFERGDRLGGTIETEIRDGFVLEKGPDSFISEKPAAVELAKKLRIENFLINTRSENRKSFILKNGKLFPVPPGFYLIAPTQALEFMKSPLLSFPARCRAMAEIFIPKRVSENDESIGSFVRRRFGDEMLERIGQPMIGGIYTGDPDRLSLLSTMPRFRDLEKKSGSVIKGMLAAMSRTETGVSEASGPRYSLFLSFKNGMETLVSSLMSQIPYNFVQFESKLTEIDYSFEKQAWFVEMQNGEVYEADAVCVAASARTAAQLFANSFPDLSRKLNRIRFESVATINFAFKRDQIRHLLDGFGFVVPKIEKRPLVACSFSSQKFEGRAPNDCVLLRAFTGGAFGREYYQMEDKDLISAVARDLAELLGIQGDALFYDLARYPNAMVQYEVGHLELVGSIQSDINEMKGLFLTGSSFKGVGIPDCIADAFKQAEAMFALLSQKCESIKS